jgi:hypothetical protein
MGALTITDLDLPTASDTLEGLTGDWHIWQWGAQWSLVRRLDERRYVAVVPYLFTWGVIVGQLKGQGMFHDERWCYHDLTNAVSAATVWDGHGEPAGWHRHVR